MSPKFESPSTNVCALVEHQVIASPEATALIVGDEQICYRSLWHRVLAISAQLQRRSLQSDEPVGILLGRSLDLVASILGIWHAGGAYVPIDPGDPASRNAHILRVANCRLLLSDTQAMEEQRGLLDSSLSIELLDLSKLAESSARIQPRYAPGSALAYILFTSGSTGVPKGVEVEQRSVMHLLSSIRDTLRFTATDRYLATTSAGFDISVAELFLPLICGGSSLLRHRELWLSPVELAREITRFGVSVVQAVPSSWALALGELPIFPHVRIAITTGEAITPQVAHQLPRISDAAWNLYGPTETTVWATARRLPAIADTQLAAATSIGFPLEGLTAVVLDERGQELPATAQGELFIGGVALARGYHRQPELTTERFMERNGTRLYRTGDIAAMELDGSITCYGRADEQLKIRGVRIEPGEVESVMQEHPEIQIAAVTWFSADDASRVVAAVYVVTTGCSPSTASILDWVAARLPAQMVPARLLRVDQLPLTTSGKIDRAAIRTLIEQEAGNMPGNGVSLLSNTERVIADAWCRILQRRSVSREEHFFNIGGDSLAAVRVAASIESTLGVTLSIRSVFEAPTLSDLAELVDRVLVKDDVDAEKEYVFELVRVPGSRPIFFSNLDVRMVTDRNWKPAATLYAISNWAHENDFLQSSTIEALARVQISGIRKRQSTGPYRLAGYAFGGLIALEIARQLEHLGETVEILFLIHPMTPFHVRTATGESVRTDASSLQGSSVPRGRVAGWLWHRRAWIQYQLAHLHARNRNPLAEALLPRDRWPAYWYHSRRLAQHYLAGPFSGPAILVGSPDAQSRKAWQKLLPALQILETSHEQMQDETGLDEWRTLLGEAMAEIEMKS